MIGRLFAATHVFFDPAIIEQIGALGGQKEVIDANAVVAIPCASLIIPERVVACVLLPRAEGLSEAEINYSAESRAAFGAKERVFDPCVGASCVFGLRNYVVISAH